MLLFPPIGEKVKAKANGAKARVRAKVKALASLAKVALAKAAMANPRALANMAAPLEKAMAAKVSKAEPTKVSAKARKVAVTSAVLRTTLLTADLGVPRAKVLAPLRAFTLALAFSCRTPSHPHFHKTTPNKKMKRSVITVDMQEALTHTPA